MPVTNLLVSEIVFWLKIEFGVVHSTKYRFICLMKFVFFLCMRFPLDTDCNVINAWGK